MIYENSFVFRKIFKKRQNRATIDLLAILGTKTVPLSVFRVRITIAFFTSL